MTGEGKKGININSQSLIECNGTILNQINACTDVEELIRLIKKLDVIKSALNAANTFRKQSVLFAQLEAQALIRLVELHGESTLKGRRKSAAVWLHSLNEEERDKYISMCEEGKVIENIWWDLFGEKTSQETSIKKAKEIEKRIFQDLEITGVADLEKFTTFVEKKFEPDTARDLVDGVRNRLRNRGYFGVQDGNGTYIDPQEAPLELIQQAFKIRVESISTDFTKICELARKVKDIEIPISTQKMIMLERKTERKLEVKDLIPEKFVDLDAFCVCIVLFMLARENVFPADEVFQYMEDFKKMFHPSRSDVYRWAKEMNAYSQELRVIYEYMQKSA